MNDNDTLIRDRLAAAAGIDVLADPRGVRDGVARRRRRIRRRRRGAGAAMVVAFAGFVGAGVALTLDRDPQPDVTAQADAPDHAPTSSEAPSSSEAPTTSEVPDASDAPRFVPAPGWEVIQAGFAATASNIPMGPDTRSGSVPWDTVEQLGEDDVALHVAASPRGGSAAMDANTPPGELPLSLDDVPPGGLEGNPEVGLTLRTVVAINGWNLDLMVFFGTAEPSAETRAHAQEQLAGLDVPARTERPLSPAPEDACHPLDLTLTLDVEEAAGIVQGRIRVRNDGAPCTLEGVPHIELRDPTAPSLDVIPTAASEAPAAWQQADAEAPEGWPAIRLDAGSEAQAVLTVRNWCLDLAEPTVFARLPYHVDRVGGDAPTMPAVPPCDDPQQPPTLEIGPLEPLRTTG